MFIPLNEIASTIKTTSPSGERIWNEPLSRQFRFVEIPSRNLFASQIEFAYLTKGKQTSRLVKNMRGDIGNRPSNRWPSGSGTSVDNCPGSKSTVFSVGPYALSTTNGKSDCGRACKTSPPVPRNRSATRSGHRRINKTSAISGETNATVILSSAIQPNQAAGLVTNCPSGITIIPPVQRTGHISAMEASKAGGESQLARSFVVNFRYR